MKVKIVVISLSHTHGRAHAHKHFPSLLLSGCPEFSSFVRLDNVSRRLCPSKESLCPLYLPVRFILVKRYLFFQ